MAAMLPKAPMANLLGEGFHTGMSATPPLKIALPSVLDLSELEIVVQVRQGGHLLAEGSLHKPAPAEGSVGKFAVELKRG